MLISNHILDNTKLVETSNYSDREDEPIAFWADMKKMRSISKKHELNDNNN